MSDKEQPPLDDLLSNFALGPAWARGDEKEKRPSGKKGGGKKGGGKGGFRDGERKGKGRRDDRRDGGPRHEGGGKFQKGKRPFKKGDKFERNHEPAAEGVRVTILPDAQAVHLIVKEIQRASPEQIRRINTIEGDNARHVQARYGRTVED